MFRRLSDWWFRTIYGLRSGLREFGRVFGEIIGVFNPRKLPGAIARDSRQVLESSRFVAGTAGNTLAGVVRLIILAPIYFLRWLVYLPGRTWYFLRTRSPIQIAVGVVVLLAGTAGATQLWSVVREKRVEILRREQFRQLEQHFSRADFNGVKHNLTILRDKSPGDAAIAARLAALEAGEALPGDAQMARLLMRQHLGAAKTADACREARKYLQSVPNDWESLLLLADDAMRRGDRATAMASIAKMPRTHELNEALNFWACAVGARLFRTLGEDERLEELGVYLADNYVPSLNHSFIENLDAAARMQLVEIYNLAMTQMADKPELRKYWVPVQKVCHGLANTPNLSPPLLATLGIMQETQRETFLRDMHRRKQITDDDYAQFVTEIEDRLTVIWRRLRETDPKNPYGYLGPAMQKARANKLADGVKEIDVGLEICGKLPELVEKKAELLLRIAPVEGLAFLEGVLAGRDLNLPMCRAVAEVALAAKRPDKALEAIQKAHAIAPDQPWALKLEAQIHLESGRATEAASAVRRLIVLTPRDKSVAVMYVRTLALSGNLPLAEQYLADALADPANRMVVLAGADALAKLNYCEQAVKALRLLIRDDPLNPSASIVLGHCLLQQAQNAPGDGWPTDLTDEAIKAYRAALLRYPGQLLLLNNIAWLELVALDRPSQAAETLKDVRARNQMPIEMLGTVGAIEVGIGNFERGRDLLQESIRRNTSRPSVSVLAYLGLAFHGLNRPAEAEAALARAQNQPKANPREAELLNKIRQKIARSQK